MIAALIVLLITGYLAYRLIRNPIKSLKFIGAVLGLLLLGAIVYAILFGGAIYILS